ncbi:glutathione transferase [Bordetella sp. 2513F-2]
MAVPLTLYVDAAFLSPYAFSAFVALSEKQVPMQLRPVDLDCGEQHMRPFLVRSPTGRVPALTHDDFHLSESSAIAQYLEEAFPPPAHPALYPGGLQPRARARQVQSWLRTDLQALRAERSTRCLFEAPCPAPLSDAAQAEAARLVRVAQELLAHGAPHLFGDWGIADTDLALMLRRLAHDADALPASLRDYAEAQWQRPAVREWVAHRAAASA